MEASLLLCPFLLVSHTELQTFAPDVTSWETTGQSWLVLSVVCVQVVPWSWGNNPPLGPEEGAPKRWAPPSLSVLQAQCFSDRKGSPLDPLLSLPTGNLRFWEARSRITLFAAEASSRPWAFTPWDYAAVVPALACCSPGKARGQTPCFLVRFER